MICMSCGKETLDDSAFCVHCGASLTTGNNNEHKSSEAIKKAEAFMEGLKEKTKKFGKALQDRVATRKVQTPADKLRELKELLDTGILTQEEFDNKKSEILKEL